MIVTNRLSVDGVEKIVVVLEELHLLLWNHVEEDIIMEMDSISDTNIYLIIILYISIILKIFNQLFNKFCFDIFF